MFLPVFDRSKEIKVKRRESKNWSLLFPRIKETLSNRLRCLIFFRYSSQSVSGLRDIIWFID